MLRLAVYYRATDWLSLVDCSARPATGRNFRPALVVGCCSGPSCPALVSARSFVGLGIATAVAGSVETAIDCFAAVVVDSAIAAGFDRFADFVIDRLVFVAVSS